VQQDRRARFPTVPSPLPTAFSNATLIHDETIRLQPRARLRLWLPGSGRRIDSRLVGASCEPQDIFIDLQSPMDETNFRQRRTG